MIKNIIIKPLTEGDTQGEMASFLISKKWISKRPLPPPSPKQ